MSVAVGIPGDGQGKRIFKGNGGPLTLIATTTDGRFYELEDAPAINSSGLVTFGTRLFLNGLSSGGAGISVGSGGALQTIATTQQYTPTSMFTGPGNDGLFLSDGNATTKVVDRSGPFKAFSGCCPALGMNRDGKIAFLSYVGGGGIGIFTGPDPVNDKVIYSTEALSGSTVVSLNISRDSINRSGQIAFFAQLADGTKGIYRADPFLPIMIDIKPDDFPNSVNPTDKGMIPVAILSTGSFDATTVDSTSVRFGANGIETTALNADIEDVNHDGLPDVLLHFRTQETGIRCGTVAASLSGTKSNGEAVQGSDSVRTVGCK